MSVPLTVNGGPFLWRTLTFERLSMCGVDSSPALWLSGFASACSRRYAADVQPCFSHGSEEPCERLGHEMIVGSHRFLAKLERLGRFHVQSLRPS